MQFHSTMLFTTLLSIIILFTRQATSQLGSVVFVTPPPFVADEAVTQTYQLGSVLDIRWTTTINDPLGLGLWQPYTANDAGQIIFGKSVLATHVVILGLIDLYRKCH